MTFCLRLSVEFSFLIFILSQLINTKNLYFSIKIASTSAFRGKQTGKICEVMFSCFMFYFSFIFFTMVYSVEQNTFIVVFYFRKEGLLMGNYLFVKMNSSIVNRFLTIRTISKGKSLGRPPVSDERVEDLMKWWKRLYRYLGTRYSQYLSVWICSHTNSCTLCGGTMGAIIVPLLVLVLNNKYIIVGRSKAQLKLVSG
jgi:hypothetical protein